MYGNTISTRSLFILLNTYFYLRKTLFQNYVLRPSMGNWSSFWTSVNPNEYSGLKIDAIKSNTE